MAVTDETRRAVWNDLLDVARVIRYAEDMESRYRFLHGLVRFSLLLSASGSVAAFLEALPADWQLYFGVAIGALVAADFMFDHATKIALLSATKRECQELETEWRQLWLDVDSPASADPGIRQRSVDLGRRFARATMAMDAQVRVNARANERCTEAAYKITAERHAATG